MFKELVNAAAQEAMRATLREQIERAADALGVHNSGITVEYGYYPDEPCGDEPWHWRAVYYNDDDVLPCGDGMSAQDAVNDLLQELLEEERKEKKIKKKKRRQERAAG